MRIPLDECLPVVLVDSKAFKAHHVEHATRIGLSQSSNGALHEIAQARFDLFITSDRHFRTRSALAPTPTLGIICLRITPNVLEDIAPAVEALFHSVPAQDFVGRLTTVWRDHWEIS